MQLVQQRVIIKIGGRRMQNVSKSMSAISGTLLTGSEQDRTTQNRFIAFLDIMGFKDRVARNEHEDVLLELELFQGNISQYVGLYQKSNIQLAMFSDSLLIFSQDDSIDSLRAISDVSAHVMMYAIQQKKPIPLKGAIAAGLMTCNQNKQLFFGQALIDAYLLEEDVKYYGILVHHTAEEYIKKYGMGDVFRDVKAPLKGGNISHYELDWYETKLDEKSIVGDDNFTQLSLDDCFNNLRLTVSDEPRLYIDNTIQVKDSVKK